MDDLKTNANLTQFTIKEVYSASVSLGEAQIDEANSTIHIPLNYGKYEKNILFSAKIEIEASAKRLLNINPDSICFETFQSEVPFYVSSKSGYSRRWVIVLDDNDQHNASADIRHMDISSWEPENWVVGDTAFIYIDGNDKYVKIMAPAADFPLTIHPHFVLSDSAKLTQEASSLTFNNARMDVKTVTVQAENGAQSEWKLYVEQGEAIYAQNNDNYTEEQLQTVNIDTAGLQVAVNGDEHNELMKVDVDSVNNTITLLMRNKQSGNRHAKFPINCTLDFADRYNQVLIGYRKGEQITLDEEKSSFRFYTFDRYNNYKKLWTVKTDYYRSSEADVLNFDLRSSSPASIRFNRAETDINHEAGIVTLIITDGISDFPATLKATIGVSQGAKLTGIESGTEFQMENINSTKEFTVTAEDGSIKKWCVKLQFAGSLANGADVETFRILSYSGQNKLMQLAPDATIDQTNKEILVYITGRANDFPLRLKALMTTSYKSTFQNGAFSSDDNLIFQNINSTYQFTLMSQDSSQVNRYTIRLVDQAPAASQAAELITFQPTQIAAGYTVANTIVNKMDRTITLKITQKGNGTFSFVPKVSISAGATLQGISNSQALSFSSMTDVKTFAIVAEDGSTVNNWSIALSYEPQLPNWNLDLWGTGASTGKPEPQQWCTSNVQLSSVAAQVTQGTGQDGTPCAKCTGKTVLGNYAAGSFFFGTFKMDISQLSNAKLMTNFYLPFDAKPKSVSADIYYTSGDGQDKMSIDFHLYNYSGSGTPSYHTMHHDEVVNGKTIKVASSQYEPNVTIVGFVREELPSTGGWVRHTTPISYDGYPNLQPNYIHIAYCCSYHGDLNEGSTNSVLYVDNIQLNY